MEVRLLINTVNATVRLAAVLLLLSSGAGTMQAADDEEFIPVALKAGLVNNPPLADPATARELQLSDEQRQRILGHVRDMQRQAQALQQQVRDSQELQREMSALRERQEESIAAVLTDAQREVWAKLTEWDD